MAPSKKATWKQKKRKIFCLLLVQRLKWKWTGNNDDSHNEFEPGDGDTVITLMTMSMLMTVEIMMTRRTILMKGIVKRWPLLVYCVEDGSGYADGNDVNNCGDWRKS